MSQEIEKNVLMLLEPGSEDVGSSMKISVNEIAIHLTLKDCDKRISWRFPYNNKDNRIASIQKAERAIVKLQEVQTMLKSQL